MEQIRKGRGGDGTREDGKKEGREDEVQGWVYVSLVLVLIMDQQWRVCLISQLVCAKQRENPQ